MLPPRFVSMLAPCSGHFLFAFPYEAAALWHSLLDDVSSIFKIRVTELADFFFTGLYCIISPRVHDPRAAVIVVREAASCTNKVIVRYRVCISRTNSLDAVHGVVSATLKR